jgi:hypothetical protein
MRGKNITSDMDIEKYRANIPAGFLEFAEVVKQDSPVLLHFMAVVGSVLTPDFNQGRSDINSLIIVQEKNLEFFDFIIKLGRRFRDQSVAPPLVMTEGYVRNSLDVFPIEFFNFQAIHYTLFGEDILQELKIDNNHLRLQCEREIKAKLLWLGQIYLECLGDQQMLAEKLAASITGYIPLFRAILFLVTGKIILDSHTVIHRLQQEIGLSTESFSAIYRMKTDKNKTKATDELYSCFSCYYEATEMVAHYVDQLSA